jgi:hypothetical protein
MFPALPVEAAPAALPDAINRQESGMNPLIVNVAGKDHLPAYKAEALKFLFSAGRTPCPSLCPEETGAEYPCGQGESGF